MWYISCDEMKGRRARLFLLGTERVTRIPGNTAYNRFVIHDCCLYAKKIRVYVFQLLEMFRNRLSCIYCQWVRSAKSYVYGVCIPREICSHSRPASCATIVHGTKILAGVRLHTLADLRFQAVNGLPIGKKMSR